MAVLAFVADCHIGNHRRFGGAVERGLNDRCRRVLATLGQAVEVSRNEGAAALVVVGDLFDNDKPLPQMIAAVQDAVGRGNDAEWEAIALVGNHDQHSAVVGDHALGPLRDRMRVVDEPVVLPLFGCELVCVPFVSGEARRWLPRALKKLLAKRAYTVPRVLALHLGISDSKTAPWLRESRDAVSAELVDGLLKEYRIDAAFAGNWHDARSWEFFDTETNAVRRIAQCGALVPTGWDNPGLDGYGHLVLYDVAACNVSRIELPGPRFVSTYGMDGWDKLLPAIERSRDERGCAIYLSVTGEPDELPALRARADEEKAAGRYVEVEVLADSAETEVAAREAAAAARSAGTLTEALAEYVAAMPLDEQVDRQRVLDLARRYLGVSAA